MFERLFFSLLESDVLAEGLAVLFEFDLTLNLLLVFACPIDLAGLFVFDLNEFVLLCHINELRRDDYSTRPKLGQVGHCLERPDRKFGEFWE